VSGVAKLAILGALLGATSCTPVTTKAAFNDAHFSSGYGYDIAYRGGNKQVLPEAWRLDNYRFNQNQWLPKQQREYVTQYDFDDNDDGRIDRRISTFTYVLRYEHRVRSGVIWLRNIPLPQTLRSKDLRVLMQSYIEELTRTTYERVRLGMNTTAIVADRRYTAAIVEQGPATIAGQNAYVAALDIADIEQLKVAPAARSRRVQLILMRAPQDEVVDVKIDAEGGRGTLGYPVLVLAGYSNMPTDFAADLPDFHGFLGQLTVGGKTGLTLQPVPTPDSTAPSTPETAASATTPAQ
jgi:hypothetical protein